MRRLFVIPFVIWFGGCSLFVYDAASFGLGGGDKSGISADVRPATNGMFANSHYTVTLTHKDGSGIYWSTNSTQDPTNAASEYMYTNVLVFSNCRPFTLYARIQYTNAPWGGLLTLPVTKIADGSAPHPWHIASRTHLSNIRYKLTNHYLQVSNINMDEGMAGDWIPIGDAVQFTGVYDGGVFSIDNLVINTAGPAGLFGSCSGARISKVTIKNADVTVDGSHAGILCGYAETGTIISGCVVENSQITNVGSTGYNTGGLIGYMEGGQVVQCAVKNTMVHAAADTAGGLVGQMVGAARADSCTVENTLGIVAPSIVGGLLGSTSAGSTVILTNCAVLGDAPSPISGGNYVGGLVGYFEGAGVYGCRVETQVQGGGYTGGLIGYLNNGIVSNCMAVNPVTGSTIVGGIVGFLIDSAILSRCMYSDGTINGSDNVGGLVGQAEGTVSQCGVLQNVVINGTNNVGGMIGQMNKGLVSQSFSQAGVNCTSQYGGGAVGYLAANTSLNNCYATGTVQGGSDISGGFVGFVQNTGPISISLSYASVTVQSNDGALGGGAFIGTRNAQITITDCYCNTNTGSAMSPYVNLVGSGLTNGITGSGPDQMKGNQLYYSSAGFVFGSGNWRIDGDPTSYPYFDWQGSDNIPY